MINERIHQLETAMEEHSSLDSNSSNKEEEIVPSETIPFVMMFIFLNYNCIYICSSHEDTNMFKEAKKEATQWRSILKLAKTCSKKFEQSGKDEGQFFSRYCSKKMHKLMKLQSIPSSIEMASINKIIETYEKMFNGGNKFETLKKNPED